MNCWSCAVTKLVKDWHSIRPSLSNNVSSLSPYQCNRRARLFLLLCTSATAAGWTSSFSLQFSLPRIKLRVKKAKGVFPLLFSRWSYVQPWEISLQRPASKHPTDQLHQSVTARLLAFVHWEQREHMNEQRLQPGGKYNNLTLNVALVTNVSRKTHMNAANKSAIEEAHGCFWWSKWPCLYQLLHSLAYE